MHPPPVDTEILLISISATFRHEIPSLVRLLSEKDRKRSGTILFLFLKISKIRR